MRKSGQALVRTLEEQALNAWPAARQLLVDGWLLRLDNGYTKRANSITPLYTSQQPVQPKIDRCCQIYRDHGLPPIFRLTPLAQPTDLDARLADLGFIHQSQTSVQRLSLTAPVRHPPSSFSYESELSKTWLDHFSALSGSVTNRAAHAAILGRITPAACFASLSEGGQVVACGLGVLEGASVGLFDLITAERQRRQGFAQALLTGILQWAIERGATQAYLQVETGNGPALNLYRKSGFSEVYQYWYRFKAVSKSFSR